MQRAHDAGTHDTPMTPALEKQIAEWRRERNRALRELDMEYARAKMPWATNDDVRLLAMHKARYECTDIEDALRHESAAWLRASGSTDVHAEPILPPGKLPRRT